jgi:hypothetical protein
LNVEVKENLTFVKIHRNRAKATNPSSRHVSSTYLYDLPISQLSVASVGVSVQAQGRKLKIKPNMGSKISEDYIKAIEDVGTPLVEIQVQLRVEGEDK